MKFDNHRCQPSQRDPVRLCYLVTHPATTRFLRGQLRHMRQRGFDVTLITSPGDQLEQFKKTEGIDVHCVQMEREIHPFRDLYAVFQLWSVLRTIRPHIVNAGTPKAGLLGMLAAFLARVPVRIYTLRGLRLETTKGVKRRILALVERVASACAHRVICVSKSLADEYELLNLATPGKTVVLGSGASNGVDCSAFQPSPQRKTRALQIRQQLGIRPSDPVIGYVGRIARDKGIADLVQAFDRVRRQVPEARLLIIGGIEKGDLPDEKTLHTIDTDPQIVTTGVVDDMASYYQVMNVLAFPSRREGFPNAVLEAQAAGLPVVGYQATGVRDAIVDGVTGCLVPVGAVDQFEDGLRRYLCDRDSSIRHGINGMRRVKEEFSNQRVWTALQNEYEDNLDSLGLPVPNVAVPKRTVADAA